jgi:hypothetical protein
VFDLKGALVMTTWTTGELHVDALAPGRYTLKVSHEAGHSALPLVVQ